MGSGFVVHGLSEVGSMCLKTLFAQAVAASGWFLDSLQERRHIR